MLALRNRTNTWPEVIDWVDRDFGRLMRQMWDNGGSELSTDTISYPVDIHEDDDNVYVDAELPGFTNEEIDVTIEQGMLQITAERQLENKANSTSRLNERRYARYCRCFTLPTAVDDSKVEAKLNGGVLHLTLPKIPEVKPRRIKVS